MYRVIRNEKKNVIKRLYEFCPYTNDTRINTLDYLVDSRRIVLNDKYSVTTAINNYRTQSEYIITLLLLYQIIICGIIDLINGDLILYIKIL